MSKNNSKLQYFRLVLIILFHILEFVIALSRTGSENNNLNWFSDGSEIVKMSSGSQSHKFNNIFKYSAHCENCTRAKRAIEKILHRQKRFLVFPMGSAIVVTMAGVKALTFSTPRGYNYLAEVDFYYPLPDKIYRLHRRTTTTHPTTTTTTTPSPPTVLPEMFDHHHPDYHDFHDHHQPTGWSHDHHGEVFMPDGGWKDDIFKNINAGESPMDENLMNMHAANSSRRYWNENLSYHNSYDNFKPPFQPSFQSQSRRRFDIFKPTQFQPPVYYRGKRSTELPPAHDDEIKLENHEDWAHYKSHRDRRDLYSHIESIFENRGIQVRTCILRAICEAKHFLMPKGKSLFHDMFRILFTIPTTNEMKDDYSNADRNHDDSDNCWKLYEYACPFSILELLLKSQKIL